MSKFDRPATPEEHMATLALIKREEGKSFDESKHRRIHGYPEIENPTIFQATPLQKARSDRETAVERKQLEEAETVAELATLRAENEEMRNRTERLEQQVDQLLTKLQEQAPPHPTQQETPQPEQAAPNPLSPAWINGTPNNRWHAKRIREWCAQHELEAPPPGRPKLEQLQHAIAVGEAAGVISSAEAAAARSSL